MSHGSVTKQKLNVIHFTVKGRNGTWNGWLFYAVHNSAKNDMLTMSLVGTKVSSFHLFISQLNFVLTTSLLMMSLGLVWSISVCVCTCIYVCLSVDIEKWKKKETNTTCWTNLNCNTSFSDGVSKCTATVGSVVNGNTEKSGGTGSLH